MNKFIIFFTVVLMASLAHAVEMGVPVQLKFKNPSGVYPDDSSANFTVQILSASNGCVLYAEDFNTQTVVSGSISLALGTGVRGTWDPNFSLKAAYDNSSAKNNLTCVDNNNNQVSSGQTYNPAATDTRVLRIRATVSGDNMVIDYIQRATPYAIHAESVGGKVASDILVQNGATSLNQSNLETLLSNATRFNKLQNLAVNGIADSAASATTAVTATNFSGNLAGDITGTQSAAVVEKIRGVTVAATTPTSGQVLAYNGSQYVPMTFAASAPVASVNGQTGAVVLTASNISGVVTSATALTGDVTGNISATVVSSVGGKTAAAVASAVTDINAATSLPTASTLARRDGSGNLIAASVLATNSSVQNVYLYEGTNTNSVRLKAPNSFADYILVLPTTDGNSGEVLQTDGSGNLSWTLPSAGGVTSAAITAALGYSPADNAVVAKGNNNLSDLASATVARANLGLGSAATLSIGTSAGTVAAGNDSRITGALQQSSFNTYVASANCTAGQSMYWNSVSSTFLCQNITVAGDVTGSVSNSTVVKIQGVGVSFTSLANNHILQYNGANMVNRLIPTCSAGQYLTFNGTAWSCATDAGFGGGISSVTVSSPLQSTGGLSPNLSITQATASVSGYLTGTDWTTFNNKMAATSAAVISALGYTPANSATVSLKANNLSDLTNIATARTNLGLGGFATVSSLDLGSASATGTLATARLPALSGDVTSTAGSNSLTVTKIQGVAVSATAPTAGQVLEYDGSSWVPATGLPQYGRVTANQSLTNTLTDLTNLTFNATAGNTYKFKFSVIFSVAATNKTVRFQLNSPTATVLAAQVQIPYSTSAITSSIVTAPNTPVAAAANNASSGQVLIALVEGIIVPSASGAVKLQSSLTAGGATLTIYAGSTLEWTQVP
ncbi:beta strand repeat-containing protein [Pseudobdellovibrio sp. HCB154]|uniref:beta strand repeat-containing protein n=1 Tax=Pseudobdellovibrio sp. HCB154 TaxID=3386277 RepID=UPI00391720C8